MPIVYYRIKKSDAELLEQHLSRVNKVEIIFSYSHDSFFPTNLNAQTTFNFLNNGDEVLGVSWPLDGGSFNIETTKLGPIIPTTELREVIYECKKLKKLTVETLSLGGLINLTWKTPNNEITRFSKAFLAEGKKLYEANTDLDEPWTQQFYDEVKRWWQNAIFNECGAEIDELNIIDLGTCTFEVSLPKKIKVTGRRDHDRMGGYYRPKFMVDKTPFALAIYKEIN